MANRVRFISTFMVPLNLSLNIISPQGPFNYDAESLDFDDVYTQLVTKPYAQSRYTRV
jgi:hypothetical protein